MDDNSPETKKVVSPSEVTKLPSEEGKESKPEEIAEEAGKDYQEAEKLLEEASEKTGMAINVPDLNPDLTLNETQSEGVKIQDVSPETATSDVDYIDPVKAKIEKEELLDQMSVVIDGLSSGNQRQMSGYRVEEVPDLDFLTFRKDDEETQRVDLTVVAIDPKKDTVVGYQAGSIQRGAAPPITSPNRLYFNSKILVTPDNRGKGIGGAMDLVTTDIISSLASERNKPIRRREANENALYKDQRPDEHERWKSIFGEEQRKTYLPGENTRKLEEEGITVMSKKSGFKGHEENTSVGRGVEYLGKVLENSK